LAFFLVFHQIAKEEVLMEFHAGDTVMHWTYGLGQIVRREERVLSGSKILYYAVQIQDMTVWVPMDDQLESRLRTPTPESGFKRMLAILSGPGNPLPEDRLERRSRLLVLLKDGRAESLCQIIRDLSAYQKTHRLNDNDKMLLKQSRNALVGEWEFVLSVSHAQAEFELYRLLASGPLEIKE
jgi:RNA polymerase-interacting CarD/CdnL/TRCF family regulator